LPTGALGRSPGGGDTMGEGGGGERGGECRTKKDLLDGTVGAERKKIQIKGGGSPDSQKKPGKIQEAHKAQMWGKNKKKKVTKGSKPEAPKEHETTFLKKQKFMRTSYKR